VRTGSSTSLGMTICERMIRFSIYSRALEIRAARSPNARSTPCGPTVYSHAQIPEIFGGLIFEVYCADASTTKHRRGFKVHRVMNITTVRTDKTIRARAGRKVSRERIYRPVQARIFLRRSRNFAHQTRRTNNPGPQRTALPDAHDEMISENDKRDLA